jgi:lysophospholipase L1-like esterase
LEQQLPEYKLFNYGKGGDTVISLYRRIKDSQLNQPVDIAFLWVGVNDVFAKLTWTYPILKTAMGQPWVENTDEFERYYRSTIEELESQANTIITAPPLFIGEDIHNQWNRELEILSDIIRRVSASYQDVHYLNLREHILPKLDKQKVSDYLPKSAARVALDAFIIKEKEQIDKKSTNRDLLFTLDGVHLNSRGAEIVADIFLKTIKATSPMEEKT